MSRARSYSNQSNCSNGGATTTTCSSVGSSATSTTTSPRSSPQPIRFVKSITTTAKSPKNVSKSNANKKKKQQQQRCDQQALATFEGRDLLIVTTAEAVLDPSSKPLVLAQNVDVIMSWHPSHSTRRNLHFPEVGNPRSKPSLSWILETTQRNAGRKGKGRSSYSPHNHHGDSFFSDLLHDDNTAIDTNADPWNRDHETKNHHRGSWLPENLTKNSMTAMLLLTSVSMIALHLDSGVVPFSVTHRKHPQTSVMGISRANENSTIHIPNELSSRLETMNIDMNKNAKSKTNDDDSVRRQQPPSSISSGKKAETGRVPENRFARTEGDPRNPSWLEIADRGGRPMRYDLDAGAIVAFRKLSGLAGTTGNEIGILASTDRRFVLGIKAEEDKNGSDRNDLDDDEVWLLCNRPTLRNGVDFLEKNRPEEQPAGRTAPAGTASSETTEPTTPSTTTPSTTTSSMNPASKSRRSARKKHTAAGTPIADEDVFGGVKNTIQYTLHFEKKREELRKMKASARGERFLINDDGFDFDHRRNQDGTCVAATKNLLVLDGTIRPIRLHGENRRPIANHRSPYEPNARY
mmetsp:Transcript_10642/g.22447  ORF Transcript_10642/g.22447 Transcript_10642/m.22447 type:complete len:577 (+) Transcript_10642:1218-2948(+)|eukprot:CAMPEP_0201118190 /NCGR_PEP_ID=MMETSP0850-20130426/2303_1 /ASSEMBLY_ACC=CAM_ASM_000622 /TAXON_ID=183588 /ORGANISM="Pseudo-nitzschia fraudulenta, Strain WWA7" /LENGTH=576 /DNA_ID=CAMNT_0047383183 /DNA_START=1128 /DNA_END=2858 /DNA_ORIENTATION=+